MKKSDILQRIPCDDDLDYRMAVEIQYDYLNHYLNKGATIKGCVNWNIEENSYFVEKNGMDKFIIMIVSTLFQIEHNEVGPDLAYLVKWDILDFETGNYDDLFSPEDLQLIKDDIRKINDYFKDHPDLIEGVEENRRKIQSD